MSLHRKYIMCNNCHTWINKAYITLLLQLRKPVKLSWDTISVLLQNVFNLLRRHSLVGCHSTFSQSYSSLNKWVFKMAAFRSCSEPWDRGCAGSCWRGRSWSRPRPLARGRRPPVAGAWGPGGVEPCARHASQNPRHSCTRSQSRRWNQHTERCHTSRSLFKYYHVCKCVFYVSISCCGWSDDCTRNILLINCKCSPICIFKSQLHILINNFFMDLYGTDLRNSLQSVD